MQNTLQRLDRALASDAGVIDLRAVAFWCLAKRERLWAEDEVGCLGPAENARGAQLFYSCILQQSPL